MQASINGIRMPTQVIVGIDGKVPAK